MVEVVPLFRTPPHELWADQFRAICEASEAIAWKDAGFALCEAGAVSQMKSLLRDATVEADANLNRALQRLPADYVANLVGAEQIARSTQVDEGPYPLPSGVPPTRMY